MDSSSRAQGYESPFSEMEASHMQIAKLDLTTRAIDLTTALLQATTSSRSLLKGAWEIGQWLGREKLNQYELLDCMQKAKGLVYANKQGQQFFDQIIRGMDTVPIGPLFLQQSASLGRVMAGDRDLSWIVSTVAGLFQHHRDEKFVTDTLTAFIIESHRSRSSQEPVDSTMDVYTYNPDETRIRAVVRKIVSSVWYNVVNVGCDTIPLPQELFHICPRGHHLEPRDFGVVINVIHAHCPTKAILRTQHLLRDVILWLLLHYTGSIVINVSGQIVYRADLGNSRRELEIHVESACSAENGCMHATRESYKILRNISGTFEKFLSGYSVSENFDWAPRPGVRQKLYDIPRWYPSDSAMWNKSAQILIRCSAQSIMQWLLGVPLLPQADFSSPGFSAQLQQQATTDQIIVSLVLKRVPAMINLQWGSSPASQVVFIDQSREVSNSRSLDDNTLADMEQRLNILMRSFPILKDLVAKISTDCLCRDCATTPVGNTSSGNEPIKLGCMKRTAVEEVLLLMAHGLADGFGANDASSVSETSPIIEGMVTLLLDLIQRRRISWNTWFAVASCIYLGCPFERPKPDIENAFGRTAFAAIQYGNMSAQAPWLDLTQEHSVKGCFALLGLKGRLGVITRSDDHHKQFRSVEENFAIIETENTEDVTNFCSRNEKVASRVDHHLQLVDDVSTIESDVILCQMDDKFYRLFLRVKTKTHWRIVDPSDTFSAVIRMLPTYTCRHRTERPRMPLLSAKLYVMDEVLGRWPDLVQSHASTTTRSRNTTLNDGTFHVTQILDTPLKKNIALALSVRQTAIINCPELACPTCTFKHAIRNKRDPLREGEGGNPADRYIINLSARMTEQSGSLRGRFIEGSNAGRNTNSTPNEANLSTGT